MSRKIAVIGDGGWGTALALTLVRNGHEVTSWGVFPGYVEEIRSRGENVKYLPGVRLPDDIRWTSDRGEAVAGADVVVFAVPTKFFRAVAESFAGLVPAACPVVSVAKGLDKASGQRMTEICEEVLGLGPAAALSGPSHAEEVARLVPTAVVLACRDSERAGELASVFMNDRFRVYTHGDVIGVELGGALKNIVAIAVGVSDGIGFGDNTRAALITRGLAEISRLGHALGADRATFAGLSGMGDLIVTCSSGLSRNRRVGERLGRGETIDEILADTQQAVEGVWNCGIARDMARERGIDIPITEEVYSIIHEGKNPQEAVESLLSRPGRAEQ